MLSHYKLYSTNLNYKNKITLCNNNGSKSCDVSIYPEIELNTSVLTS